MMIQQRVVPIHPTSPSFFLRSIGERNPRGSDGDAHRHMSPPWRVDHTSVRVGGRHTLAACSPPSPSPCSAPPAPAPLPAAPVSARTRCAPVDQDPPKLRNQNLGIVADSGSSGSLPGSSNSAAERHGNGNLDKRSQEKAPKKTHKAEREKLKRDQLNDLFVELSSMLELDRQNSGKATILGDAARVLRDLVTQVESLRKEQSALLTERQYVGSEKNELQEENTTLKAQILELHNELVTRMGNNSLSVSSLGVSHSTGSSSANLATQSRPNHIWNNSSNLSTMPMAHPTNASSPLQNQNYHSTGSRQVHAARPQELQLFPSGTSASPGQEHSRQRSNPVTSSSVSDSLPGQLRLSLPQASREESSSGALGSRKGQKKG